MMPCAVGHASFYPNGIKLQVDREGGMLKFGIKVGVIAVSLAMIGGSASATTLLLCKGSVNAESYTPFVDRVRYGDNYTQYRRWVWGGTCVRPPRGYGPGGFGRWCRQCVSRFGRDQCGPWMCC